MHSMTGHTSGGSSIVPRDRAKGCRWRCTTCDRHLRGRSEVREHWAQFSEGHSLFERVGTGRPYHQTIEGLHRRMLTTAGKVDD